MKEAIDVLLREFGRWSNAEPASDATIGATGALANVIAELVMTRPATDGFKPESVAGAAEIHAYIKMLRALLMARFEFEVMQTRLSEPRHAILVQLACEAAGIGSWAMADRIGVSHRLMDDVGAQRAKLDATALEKLYDVWEHAQPLDRLPPVMRFSHPPAAEGAG